MLENLFNLVKEQGASSVIENPAIPNEQNNAVLADATHSVADGLQGVLAGGGLQNVLSLFNSKNNNSSGGISSLLDNPIVRNIISNFTNKLTNNHRINRDQASGIANNLIPSVLSNLVNRTNDPNNNSFDINSIIGSLTGGNTQPGAAGGFDLQSILGNFTHGGLDANGDGKVGLADIMSKITGGAHKQQQQEKNGGGGIMDIIQGFLK